MILFNYPNNETKWLADFNRRVNRNSFNKGVYGLAFDVWRDKSWLFGSYTYEQAESLQSFCDRSYPDIEHHNFEACAMGAGPTIGGIDRFQVPTWAAIDHSISLKAVSDILAAAMATAIYPVKPDAVLDMVPNDNSLRQRLHNNKRDWMRVLLHHPIEDVVIRAVIARSDADQTRPDAIWDVSLYTRDALANTTLEARWSEVDAPMGDMTNVSQRTEVMRKAKKAVEVTGMAGRVIESSPTGFVLQLDSEPFNLGVTLKEESEMPTKRTEGFAL